MQLKDIPEGPILAFLASPFPGAEAWQTWATWFEGFPNSVLNAMPEGVTPKMARLKMGAMIRKGLVHGCACGCRGDFRLKE